jgi:phosphoribosylformylglycinamidine synthase
MSLDATDEADAHQKVETACQKLLANIIMETYHFELKEG